MGLFQNNREFDRYKSTKTLTGEEVGKTALKRDLPGRGVEPFGVSGPHWKKKSCLGPHIKYTNTNEN